MTLNKPVPIRLLAYNVAVVMVSFFALSIFTVTYVGHAINQNNRPFCAVVVAITEPRPQPPNDPNVQPSTPYGQDLKEYNLASARYDEKVSARLHALSQKYQCE